MNEPTPLTPAALVAKLAAPFPASAIGWKPKAKEPTPDGKMPCVPYLVGHVIEERLDEVLGPDGWEDAYEPLDGLCVLCSLRVRLGSDRWVQRQGIGGPSKQEDAGDRLKAAETQALKRAAAKLGVGRYVARLPKLWLAYDRDKKRITETPGLPNWAVPGTSGRPPTDGPDRKFSANTRRALVECLAQADARLIDVLGLAVQYVRTNSLLLEPDLGAVLAAGKAARERLNAEAKK